MTEIKHHITHNILPAACQAMPRSYQTVTYAGEIVTINLQRVPHNGTPERVS